jgi:hypothetical protein
MTKIDLLLCYCFPQLKSFFFFDQNWVGLHFGRFFSQTHLVNLDAVCTSTSTVLTLRVITRVNLLLLSVPPCEVKSSPVSTSNSCRVPVQCSAAEFLFYSQLANRPMKPSSPDTRKWLYNCNVERWDEFYNVKQLFIERLNIELLQHRTPEWRHFVRTLI